MKEKKQKKQYVAIGGQALLEGVMMRGKTAMAMAVRCDSGDILLETERIKPKKKIAKVPVIRGIISFINSLALGITTLTRSADALGEEDEKLSTAASVFAVLIGLVFALGLFFVLPGFLAGLFNDYVYDNVLVKNLVSGAIRVGLFIGYLAVVSLMKDIRRTFMYHGAEHKTINCFEAGLPLSIENVQTCSTRHNRCGTTFLFMVMIISIVVFAFVDWGLTAVIPMQKGMGCTFSYMGIKFLFLPLVAGLSFEVLFAFAKMPDNWFTNALRAPGLALQKLTTRQPNDDMVEVAIQSFTAVYEMDKDPHKKTQKFDEISMDRVRSLISQKLQALFAEEAEGQWLLCEVTGRSRSELYRVKHLDRKEFAYLKELLARREHQPLDYCLGVSNFFGRDIYVDSRVLIPRMETETLCETAIKTIGENQLSVLDLCTGSGCIALTIANQTQARVVAADISDDALEVAKKNLADTDVHLIKSDMFSGLTGLSFDIIISNPPYIKTHDIKTLQPEVRVQPHLALDGGEDGLDFYRILARDAHKFINKDGYLILEVGCNQASAVSSMLKTLGGFETVEVIKDLFGKERVLKAKISDYTVKSLDKNKA